MAQASAHLRSGRLAEAESICRGILRANGRYVPALHLLGVIALQSGQPGPALEMFDQAAGLEPRNADLLSDRGLALGALGHDDDAAAAFEAALAVKPSHAMANYNRGVSLLRKGDARAAARHLDRAVRKAPDHVDALISLGAALAQQGTPVKAAQPLNRALKLAPGHPQALLNLGSAFLDQGRFDEAAKVFLELSERQPRSKEAAFHAALAFAGADRDDEAVASYERALAIDPDYADAHNNLGNLLGKIGRATGAIDHLTAAARLRPDDARVRVNLGLAYGGLNRNAEAIEHFREALERDPDLEAAYAGIAQAEQYEGRFDDAARTIDQLLERVPNSATARWLMAVNNQRGASTDQIDDLKRQLAGGSLDAETRAMIEFALGRALVLRESFDEAFEAYARGNALLKATTRASDPDRDDADAERIIRVFDAAFVTERGRYGSDSERPVFIVGMPRSGTTLVEQIIASHPAAEAAGELPDIGEIAVRLDKNPASALDEAYVARAVADYEARLDLVSRTAARITDKMPYNYEHIGLIAVLFPRARFVHCRRDPHATGVSIFTHRFAGSHSYSHDLYDIGRCHRRYRRLMDHWRTVAPERVHDIDYEDTVDDLEAVSRRLLAFCGLEWDDRVLRYYETERAVRTASMWQVRQPIYRGALDAWRDFDAHLDPFRRGLAGEPPPNR